MTARYDSAAWDAQEAAAGRGLAEAAETIGAVRARAGRLGGIMRAATASSPADITRAANGARWQKYLDRAREAAPGVTDEADITRRAQLLQRADMCRLSARAAAARRARAAARRAPVLPGEAS